MEVECGQRTIRAAGSVRAETTDHGRLAGERPADDMQRDIFPAAALSSNGAFQQRRDSAPPHGMLAGGASGECDGSVTYR
ncbi:hypothetical protein [Burkholderia anthina]|uniref:hypothetical protein n=1 Tax=Burkholderia anthina TaxID=179879 RepID=UPI00158E9F1F|nr:hypothetical protein [Burkholderia anthina]